MYQAVLLVTTKMNYFLPILIRQSEQLGLEGKCPYEVTGLHRTSVVFPTAQQPGSTACTEGHVQQPVGSSSGSVVAELSYSADQHLCCSLCVSLHCFKIGCLSFLRLSSESLSSHTALLWWRFPSLRINLPFLLEM